MDGCAIFGEREVEFGLAGFAVAWVLDWAAGGVVVVAEFFVAEAWAAAAVAVGQDVSALVAFCVLHVGIPLGTFGSKVFKRKDLSPDFRIRSFSFGLNVKARLCAGLFVSIPILTGWVKLNRQLLDKYIRDCILYQSTSGGVQ